jgi:cell division protein FtsB
MHDDGRGISVVAVLAGRIDAAGARESNLMALREQALADPARFDRRQRFLLIIAWAATLLPLVAFAYLTWQSVELKREVDEARRDLTTVQENIGGAHTELKKLEVARGQLEAQIAQLTRELDAQRTATQHYRDYAGIRIRFYRESDRAIVEQALVNLGFKIDSRLGQSKLIDLAPNTIAYGTDVAAQDLRDIAIALVKAGFPLKRIAPAQKQPDPKLIQIYASVESERQCGLLSIEDIRAGRTCGDIAR